MVLLEEVNNWGKVLGVQMLKPGPVFSFLLPTDIEVATSALPAPLLPISHNVSCHADNELNS